MISELLLVGFWVAVEQTMAKRYVKRRVFQLSHGYLSLIVNNYNLIEVFYILFGNVSILPP